MNKTPLFPFLIADIGGTNARFGITDDSKDEYGRLIVKNQKTYSCMAFNSFETVLDTYLQTINCKPQHACIAIAGPVINDSIKMTNLNWSFSIEALCKQFDMTDIKIINDFGASAYGTLNLQKHELEVLYPGNEKSIDPMSTSRAVIGPGTGLGVAGLIRTPNNWQPVCGEGGHMSFAALNDLEAELRRVLLRISPNQGHLPREALVSGPGLVNIYRALCHINNDKEQALTPSDISSKARDQSNQQCIETIRVFSQLLGSTAGDIALLMGAFGGVYLSGGILPKIIDLIDKELFIERFLNKGAQQELLESIPIHLVTSEITALTGAAHWFQDTYLD